MNITKQRLQKENCDEFMAAALHVICLQEKVNVLQFATM